VKICAHCQKPIQPGESYREHIPDSLSGARPTDYYHRQPCHRPPTQTAPIGRRR